MGQKRALINNKNMLDYFKFKTSVVSGVNSTAATTAVTSTVASVASTKNDWLTTYHKYQFALKVKV